MHTITRSILATALLGAAACGPRVPLQRIMTNGTVLQPRTEGVVERTRLEGDRQREELAQQRGELVATALATCAPAICEAVVAGQLALGMNQEQVLAATGTTPQAWDIRGSGRATSMTARSDLAVPSDASARIAFVSLQDGRVSSYTYAESQGYRTVATPQDESSAARVAAQADALLRQGDEFTIAGRLDLALERFDQADILRPNHPETTLKIATTLDKQLRPIEAILRYRTYIHQLELERIRAHGEVAASIAEAIARAHERIIVLERQ